MPLAPINADISLYYESNGAGPAVVFAHGGGSNHMTWWKQVYDLMDAHQVITFDHRGFGFSTGEFTPSAFVDDLVRLLDHIGVEQVALVGQSMGGYTSAGFASAYPDRMSALVLTSGAAGLLPPPEGGHSARAAQRGGAATTYEEFLAGDRAADGFATRDPRDYFLFHSIGMLNFRADPRRFPEVVSLRFSVESIVAANIPLLMIAGEEDATNVAVMGQIATLIPGAEVHTIPEAGHHVMFERAQEANAILKPFLARHAR